LIAENDALMKLKMAVCPNEIGAPKIGIESLSDALTPQDKNLKLGTWARATPPRHLYAFA
jgi:hypothetical protein